VILASFSNFLVWVVWLLAEPIKRVPVADADLYDTPIPYYRTYS